MAYLMQRVILLFVVFQIDVSLCAATPPPGGGCGLPGSGCGLSVGGRGLPGYGRGLPGGGLGLPGSRCGLSVGGRGLPGAQCDTEHCFLLCFRLMSHSGLLLLPLVVGVVTWCTM